jgi:hypothetical protein
VVVARAPKALSAALTSRFFFSTYPIHLDMAGLIDWSWTARSLRAPKADARRMFLAKLQCQPILSNRCVIQVIYTYRNQRVNEESWYTGVTGTNFVTQVSDMVLNVFTKVQKFEFLYQKRNGWHFPAIT